MNTSYSRILSTFIGALALCSAQPTFADDSEVFTSTTFAAGAGVNANVLFIVDTSGSMNSEVMLYDNTITYPAPAGFTACNPSYIYYRTGNNETPPTCGNSNYFLPTANRCRDAYLEMSGNGWWSGRAAQLNSALTAWGDIGSGVTDRKIECQLDRTIHGDANPDVDDTGTRKYARSGTATTNRWTATQSEELNWGNRTTYSFYTGNYINWKNTPVAQLPGGIRTKTRIEIVKEVATGLITDLQGVNLGLMRYSNNGGCSNVDRFGRDQGSADNEWEARGGMVTYPISALNTTTRQQMIDQINSWEPEGWTPLSETLFEAHQYLSGGTVTFGQDSGNAPANHYPSIQGADYSNNCSANAPGDFRDRTATHNYGSAAGSRTGGSATATTYDSPMDFSCQQTYIVYLTDGLPTQDTEVNAAVPALPGFNTDGRVPFIEPTAANYLTAPAAACPGNATDDGQCMANLAGYMAHHDMRPGNDVVGAQTAKTYIVGFGDDIRESADYLSAIAEAGGGQAYTQGSSAGLRAALEEIFSQVRQNANTTFVSPTVAVNAFNRTRNLNTLFISVFAPTAKVHWPGNLKKYQLINGVVYGSNGSPAVDTDTDGPGPDTNTGFFADGTRDLFNTPASNPADGPDVRLGGAASQLPVIDPAATVPARNVYTYLGNQAALTNSENAFRVSNTLIRYDMLGLASATERDNVMKFTLGLDVNDEDGDLDTTDTRKAMGDPMHAQPAVAIYGGTEASPQGVVYTTTNDGMLHAFDMNTGAEDWAFIPEEMLSRLESLRRNRTIATRTYGLDGDVRVFKYDVNGDGIVNTGDKMYVIFGFARGGGAYYALDVTQRNSPRFLWKKLDGALTMLGQAWSTPQITRVNIAGTVQTDPQKFVLIFGAGYDPAQDGYRYVQDGDGAGLYMLELSTGNVLWSGGRTGTPGVNWDNPNMNNAIPADVTVVDLNGDTFGDRMYVGDMGGRIWRFDIWHGQAPDDLVTGGIIATLGVGHTNPTNSADINVVRESRRFYNSADVSLVTPRGARPFFNIAIGSGYRGHPLETDTRDRFYSVRDYRPFDRMLDTDYTAAGFTAITDAALVDVTTNVNAIVGDGAPGWKIELRSDGWRGEKVLGDSVTVGGVIFFPTFTPVGADRTNPCLAATLNRTWAVYLDSAKPFGLLTGQDPGTGGGPGGWAQNPASRYDRNWLDGIAPGTSVIMGGNCNATGTCEPVCLVGASTHKCPKVGGVTRTFWERRQ